MSSLGRGLESLIPSDDSNLNSGMNRRLPDDILPRPEPASAVLPVPIHRDEIMEDKQTKATHDGHSPAKPKKLFDQEAVFQIELEKIKPNPDQPRRLFDKETLKELAMSIREYGVLQPIVVSKVQHDTDDGSEVEYQLIAGERRLMASEMAGLPRIPAIIRSVGARREQLELAILENLQREDLTPIEMARAFARLQDEFALTQREIAAKLGKSRESVANTLRLLNLPTPIQQALEAGKINESQGRLLLAVEDLRSQEQLFMELVRDNLSVRELRSRIRSAGRNTDVLKPVDENDSNHEEMRDVKERLELFFGAPVKVEQSGDTGKIVISFYSPEELQNIISRLHEQPKGNADGGASEIPTDLDEFVV